jgi:dipeptidyl aminopeptidase/acylaminoacyl peptidase
VIGARYEATSPTYKLWLPDHPDAQLIAELHGAFPGKEVSVFDSSRDRNFLILIVESDREPGTFYLLDRAAKKATIIARRYPWLPAEKQGPQKPFTMKARDGLALNGLLTLPPGSSGKNLPLVVLPHGGPHGMLDGWGFDPELQILAQHGYAVLQVNYRGSGGYGWQFEEKGYRQWGRKMQDDVTDATKWAIAEGVADPNRICIYGASYGGYAALMGPIREPGLYRCAAGLSGVFDLSKMYKWGSIRRSDLGMRYLKRVLGEDQAELAANSPAKLADKLGVPVLLAHGYLDARVDVKHAQLMARELGKRKHPVEYQEYSATGHALRLRRHQLDFYTRLLRFLDANIGKGAATTAAAAPVNASASTTAPVGTAGQP